jgi:hypothetical protein
MAARRNRSTISAKSLMFLVIWNKKTTFMLSILTRLSSSSLKSIFQIWIFFVHVLTPKTYVAMKFAFFVLCCHKILKNIERENENGTLGQVWKSLLFCFYTATQLFHTLTKENGNKCYHCCCWDSKRKKTHQLYTFVCKGGGGFVHKSALIENVLRA